MRVAVLHNDVPPDAPPAERDVLVQVEAVCGALRERRHEPVVLAVSLNLGQMCDELRRVQPDVVFNLVESLGGSDRLMCLAATVLDVLGYPYTGSPTEALFALRSKLAAKRRMREAGLPTPEWIEAEDGRKKGEGGRRKAEQRDCKLKIEDCRLKIEQSHEQTNLQSAISSLQSAIFSFQSAVPFPASPLASPPASSSRYIIKPLFEHASLGVEAASVIDGQGLTAVRGLLRQRQRQLGTPVFAEQYVEGREFNVSLLAGPEGPQVLPLAEIDFSAFPPGMPRIVDHRAKWEPDSFEYCHTPRRFDFPEADRSLLAEISSLSRCCWHWFGLGGYARVDVRVDRRGKPWILEVNANPCLAPDAGFAAALTQAGISFSEAVERVLRAAAEGVRRKGEGGRGIGIDDR